MNFPLIGNNRVKKNLQAMIDCGHLPHAVIIEGDEGLGKKTLAKFYAKALLCTEDKKPCLVCKSCHLAEVGSHPDFQIIKPDGATIKVEQIRALKNEAYLTPLLANGRVFVIENANLMNDNAQNALLKILEEPPSGVFFILLTKSAALLLETVRSRCVCFNLVPVPVENEEIEKVADLCKTDFNKAALILTESGGNIGKAINLFNDDGEALGQMASELLRLAAVGNRLEILKKLQPYIKNRATIGELVFELKTVVAKEINKKSVKELSSFTLKRLYNIYTELNQLEKLLEFNPMISLVFCKITSILCEEK